MRRDELNFELPPERIAQQPAEPRDSSRLLVLHRAEGRIEHRVSRDLPEYLRRSDCLVRNITRVIPARFYCRRATGGRVEGLFLRETGDGWRVLLKPSARLKVGQRLALVGTNGLIDERLELCERLPRGEWRVRAEPDIDALALLSRIGQTPLPPYIERGGAPDGADSQRYQTVYAAAPGAVAAPTAGLHFTPALLDALRAAGVRLADVTLHVGLGTFAPIDVDDLTEHKMHSEWFEMNAAAAETIRTARADGGRIAAVGTTAARVLESLPGGRIAAASDWTDMFIYPPYAFRNVDMLLTNFHLPGSTLIALVMALAGVEATRAAYATAIAEGYRFYSYGDAMLIV